MKYQKLLFIGPVGAGKTSAIRALSEHDENIETEAVASDLTGLRKSTTTVAMDYSSLPVSEDETILLYGTPGQARFRFMWDLLANNLAADCAGIIFLVDNTRNYPMQDLKYYAREFGELIARKQVIIGVTRSDLRAEPKLEEYQATLDEFGIDAPIEFIDARLGCSVLPLVQRILEERMSFDDWPSLYERAAERDSERIVQETDVQPQESDFEVDSYQGDTVVVKDSIVDDVMNFQGVRGAALTDEMGEIVTSSIESQEVNDFVGFIAGLVKVFEETSDLGTVQSVVLKSTKEDNLSVFFKGDQTLGVQSSNRVSVRTLKQQVDDVLQWG